MCIVDDLTRAEEASLTKVLRHPPRSRLVPPELPSPTKVLQVRSQRMGSKKSVQTSLLAFWQAWKQYMQQSRARALRRTLSAAAVLYAALVLLSVLSCDGQVFLNILSVTYSANHLLHSLVRSTSPAAACLENTQS